MRAQRGDEGVHVQRIWDALLADEPDASDILGAASAHSEDVERFWEECADPALMLRVAGRAGVDPRVTVRAAVECAAAVLSYVGEDEPRPARAVDAARRWLAGGASAAECLAAAEDAELAGAAYRDARKDVGQEERRKYRAAAYASLAAVRCARGAHAAAVTAELEYDELYSYEDAWDGARLSCAAEAVEVARHVVEAAVNATAAQVTDSTGSHVAGAAAARECRDETRRWAAALVRAQIPAAVVREAADTSLGPTRDSP